MAGLLDLIGDIFGSNDQSKAISQASQAQQNATTQALNLADTEYANSYQGELPYETTGTSAEAQLAQMYGLANGGTVTAGGIQGGVNAGADLNPNTQNTIQSATAGINGTSYNASDQQEWTNYLQQNPSVAASYQAQINNPGFKQNFPTAQDFAAWSYQQGGQKQQGFVATPTLPSDGGPGSTTTAAPASGAGGYTNAAGGASNVDPNASFYLSPDYNFALQRGLGGLQAQEAATGQVDSGAADKAAIQFSSGLATQDYQNYANTLKTLAAGGQAAAAGQAQNNQNLTTTGTNLLTNAGNNQASAYLGQGTVASNSINSLTGTIDSVGQNLLSSFGG